MRSLVDSQELAQSLPPAVRVATATGAIVESGADSDARTALIDAGLWTNGTHKFTFERSLLGSVFIEMEAEELHDKDGSLDSVDLNSVNIVDGTNDNQYHQIDLLTTDPFIQIKTTVSGASGEGLLAGASIQNGHPLRTAGGEANPGDAAGLLA